MGNIMVVAVFAGSWHIVWMSGWDQDCVDMNAHGHITFDKAARTPLHAVCLCRTQLKLPTQ